MKTFAERLQEAARKGGLSYQDLAVWFDRGYATVYSWSVGRRLPTMLVGDPNETLDNLILLEKFVEAKGFGSLRSDNFVSAAYGKYRHTLNSDERKILVRSAKQHAYRAILGRDPAGRKLPMRRNNSTG